MNDFLFPTRLPPSLDLIFISVPSLLWKMRHTFFSYTASQPVSHPSKWYCSGTAAAALSRKKRIKWTAAAADAAVAAATAVAAPATQDATDVTSDRMSKWPYQFKCLYVCTRDGRRKTNGREMVDRIRSLARTHAHVYMKNFLIYIAFHNFYFMTNNRY